MKSVVHCGAENAVSTNTDNKVVSLFPAMKLGGAADFIIKFNFGN